jgi:hypothetical protein
VNKPGIMATNAEKGALGAAQRKGGAKEALSLRKGGRHSSKRLGVMAAIGCLPEQVRLYDEERRVPGGTPPFR